MPFKSERLSEPQVGDRVRVTFEATISDDSYGCICTSSVKGGAPLVRRSYIERLPEATVEKLEPPVEVFKPGDAVRRKFDGAPILLTTKGYAYLRGISRGNFYSYGSGYRSRDEFTSERYERIEFP